MPLRLSEAQQLLDGLSDPLLRPALQGFTRHRREELNVELFQEAKKREHDTKRISFLAGQIEAYEALLPELEKFAADQLKAGQ